MTRGILDGFWKNIEMRVCEDLPLGITLFERRGYCEKGYENCTYFRDNGGRGNCYKKTYCFEPRVVF